MAWNEPGGSGGKDPWGGRNNEQGPPDLDEVIKKLQQKLSGLFGGSGGSGAGPSSGSGAGMGSGGFGLVVALLAIVWGVSG